MKPWSDNKCITARNGSIAAFVDREIIWKTYWMHGFVFKQIRCQMQCKLFFLASAAQMDSSSINTLCYKWTQWAFVDSRNNRCCLTQEYMTHFQYLNCPGKSRLCILFSCSIFCNSLKVESFCGTRSWILRDLVAISDPNNRRNVKIYERPLNLRFKITQEKGYWTFLFALCKVFCEQDVFCYNNAMSLCSCSIIAEHFIGVLGIIHVLRNHSISWIQPCVRKWLEWKLNCSKEYKPYSQDGIKDCWGCA